jgi:hypothetical protein
VYTSFYIGVSRKSFYQRSFKSCLIYSCLFPSRVYYRVDWWHQAYIYATGDSVARTLEINGRHMDIRMDFSQIWLMLLTELWVQAVIYFRCFTYCTSTYQISTWIILLELSSRFYWRCLYGHLPLACFEKESNLPSLHKVSHSHDKQWLHFTYLLQYRQKQKTVRSFVTYYITYVYAKLLTLDNLLLW